MKDQEIKHVNGEVDPEEIDDETLDAESRVVMTILEGTKKARELFERHSRVDPDYWDEFNAKLLEATSPEQDKLHAKLLELLEATSPEQDKLHEGIKESFEAIERASGAGQFIDENYEALLAIPQMKQVKQELMDSLDATLKTTGEALDILALSTRSDLYQPYYNIRVTEHSLLEDKLDKLARMMVGKFLEEIGGRLEPVEPSPEEHLDEWFAWYHLRKKMKIPVTLKDVADKSHRSHQHVKNRHTIYKAGREEL